MADEISSNADLTPKNVEKMDKESPPQTLSPAELKDLKKEENSDHEVPSLKSELANLKTLYEGRTQPSLPNVLAGYGDDSKQKTNKQQQSSPKVRKKKKRKPGFLEGDDERDREREKLKDEKYLGVVDDLHKLRNYYYREYRDLLTEKIIRQRQEIKEKSEAAMLGQTKTKDNEQKASEKRKLTKHKLVHNEDFLKNVKPTNTAKIINLQMKLQKQGKLKNQSEIDEFWRTIKDPEIFSLYFDNTSGTPDMVFSELTKTSNRPLSQINESAESSRPTTRGDNWAVTQHYKHQHKNQGVSRQKTSSSLAKQQAANADKKFAMVEMPPLHCFTMDLSEKPPDPEDVSKKVHLKAIEKQRKKFMGKLHKMHQLAMANHALASRILAQHEDMTMFLEGPQLSDLISDYYYNKPSQKQLALPSPPPSTNENKVFEISTNQYQVLPDIPSRRSSEETVQSVSAIEDTKRSRPISTSTENKIRMIMDKPSRPEPLTMEEVISNCKVVEAVGLSTNWTNYLRAGKAN